MTEEKNAVSCCAACGCSSDDLPWAGRGTDLPIAGCRFSLYPMTDRFVDIILGALEKTDTENVWAQSDALSTVYRGKLAYVADAVKALFINAWQEGVHMAIEGQYSKGVRVWFLKSTTDMICPIALYGAPGTKIVESDRDTNA